MKIYKSQSEVEKDIKDGVLTIEGDVKFDCNISINATIKVINGDINANNIDAHDINANNIDAHDINAYDINAYDIDAHDINAYDINAYDINANNIDARDILYYAFCCVYNSIKCLSIKAKREVHQKLICLDGELEIKKETDNPQEITIKGAKYRLVED